jgi:LmbE family N-acetylglucosaminyl deacetylase
MKFSQPAAELFVPDGIAEVQALERTTHLCLAAHQDDIEIMAAAPILDCFQQPDRWFTGVVVTDGRGSPRDALYRDTTDEEMRLVRFKEQKKAAVVGEFAAQILLDVPSKVIKDPARPEPVEDILSILQATRPQFVFTHNLADKHDTHVAVALRVIAALRRLPDSQRPEKVYGCEVWRDLDWTLDADKVAFDTSAHENLQAALLGVFDSQIAGGKRYDLASMGRRRANATYYASHGTDATTGMNYAIDLTPLVADPQLDVQAYVQAFVDRFAEDVRGRIGRLK